MQYFVHGRDRPGAFELKKRLTEDHWSFMDGYTKQLVARGPTLTGFDDDAEPTGSLHIVELPDVEAVRAFAYRDPYNLAGVFASVQLYRFNNLSDRTMWEFTDAVDGYRRFLVITRDESDQPPVSSRHLIVYGDLFSLEDGTRQGRAALLEAPDPGAAAAMISADDGSRTEVHPWCFGGRRA